MNDAIFRMLRDSGTIYYEQDGKKVAVMQLAVTVSWYYDGLGSLESKKATIALLEEYAKLMEGQIRWTTNPDTGKYKRIKSIRDYAHPDEWLLDGDPRDYWWLTYKGGEKGADVSDVLFRAFGMPQDTPSQPDKSDGRSLSSIRLHFPVTFMEKDSAFFPSLLSKWAEILPPYHGRAGFSYAIAPAWFDRSVIKLAETKLLFSHPGLNYTYVGEEHYHGGGLSDGPKCADWMLFLSPKFVTALGGKASLRNAMQPYTSIEYTGGMLLQVGDYPQLGEALPGWALPEYQHLAAVIEPVRAKNMYPCMYEPEEKHGRVEAVASRPMMESWCTRFAPGAIYPKY